LSAKATPIKAQAVKATLPVKTGNGKTIQRKTDNSVLPSIIQRKEQPGSWVHRSPQKAVSGAPLVQPKVKIHSSNDHFEKEADHVADKVVSNEKISSSFNVSKVSKGAQRKCASCEKEEKNLQAMHIQRKCSSCEKEEPVQRKTTKDNFHSSSILHSSDNGPPASHEHSSHKLDTLLSNQNSRGSPLPQDTQTLMESRMGADFSNVRVHTDAVSHDATTSIGARAFTHGGNIHFSTGEFNPQTKAGQHLLAHELTHTMQQEASPSKHIAPKNSSVKGLRKVVPKAEHEKKIARISTPHHDKDASRKDAHENFTQKFKNKKAPKLPASVLKKEKGKKLNKDPIALPKNAEKKKDKPAKPTKKTNHLQHAKVQQEQLGKLSSTGIKFKPLEDKKAEEDPAQKKQALQSKNLSDKVLSKAAQSANIISNTIARVRPTLTAASAKAIARVKANEQAQKENIKNDIKTQKADVKKAMQNAAGTINAKHKKVLNDLKTAATTARDDIVKAKTKNTDDIKAAADAQTPLIDKAYTDAQKDYEKSGSDIGNECSRRQHERSQNEFLSKLKYEDDSFLDGPYTDDMKRARSDAAIKVGDGYKDGITKAGVDQGAEVIKGKPNDLKKVADGRDEMVRQVGDSYDKAFKGIEAAEKAGISQADSTKKSMLKSVYSQHKAAQAKLDTTEKTQTQFVEILSVKQSQQIELQAEQATEAMEEGGAKSLTHLNNGFKEYKQVCESMNSPPPAMLQLKLQPIEEKLAQTAPSMISSLQKGMVQTELGFIKTANETISTTNSTVTQSLSEAKTDNDKAIDGLKKLQSAAYSALQGIFTKNKKTITDTASQCVTDIQNIKSSFDTSLSNILTDLKSGMQNGAQELKTGLQTTVDNGSGETKSMLTTSKTEEDKAADEVEPRWKSALKILLVVVVTLIIALVVGPAVIGFISAAAGGGLFGAAVGAVVGGAILGAASSAVITIGNNLIDGKTWYKGVGHAMLEGAITGAIGGAFGAAGGGIAGKIIGTAAKGVGPALGRFAIQQTIDFGGNIVTEYASSKLQGKPFSWTNVAQGQAIGAGMHIGMGGIGALKDVKGFKTVHNITEASAAFGGKLGGAVRTKFAGAPVVETNAGVKPAVEEPTISPKEEPHPSSKPAEETKASAPKEETQVSRPTEETKVAPKEEPSVSTTPKEEPVASKPVEETKATPKEEVKATATEEPVTPNGKKKSELPANLTNEEVEMGIVAKAETEDGHHIKVTENGEIIKCSTCQKLETKYEQELKNPDIKEEFEKIKAMPEGEEKARAARNFDRRMEDRMVRQYQRENPNTKYTELEIKQKIRAGERMNPETGLFNKPETELKIDKYADFEKEGTGSSAKTKVDEYDPSAFHDDVKAKTDEFLKQREAAQKARDAHPEGSGPYKEEQVKVIKASENLGNNAAEGVAREKGFTGEPLNVGTDFKDGAGTFDRVFEKDGKYLVAESKGGGSGLGSREVIIDGEPTRVQQGTKEYFESICQEMMGPNRSAAEQELGAKLLAASKSGKVDYIMVQQPVNVSNELGIVKVKTFK